MWTDKRQTRAFEGFAAESGAELLRIATLLTPDRGVKPRPTPANDIVFSQAMSFLWNPSTPPALRAALLAVLAGMPRIQVDPSARDMLGRRAVKISWTASDTTVYTVYENPAAGTVLEQTYKWPADMDLAPATT